MTGGAAGAKNLPGLDTPAVRPRCRQSRAPACSWSEELGCLARLPRPVVPAASKSPRPATTAPPPTRVVRLMNHLGLATIGHVLLMAVALGRREAVVVAVAVPVTLALTLASSYLFGYR